MFKVQIPIDSQLCCEESNPRGFLDSSFPGDGDVFFNDAMWAQDMWDLATHLPWLNPMNYSEDHPFWLRFFKWGWFNRQLDFFFPFWATEIGKKKHVPSIARWKRKEWQEARREAKWRSDKDTWHTRGTFHGGILLDIIRDRFAPKSVKYNVYRIVRLYPPALAKNHGCCMEISCT